MKIAGSSFLVLLCLIMAPIAQADKPRFGDTFSFSVGGMAHSGKATVSSTREGAPVDRLTFKDLGIDDETEVVWGDFTWQFFDRWQFSLSYSSFDANGMQEQTESGNIDDLEWEAGATLTSSIDLKFYIADITWDFVKTENAHVGVGLGLHVADIDLDVLAEGFLDIGGEQIPIEIGREEVAVTAPLPNLSLVGGVMLGEKVYLGGHLGYFSLEYDKYDGELTSARGMVEWRPWRHFGLGLAYQYVNMNLDVDGSTTQDAYDMEFYGPVLFLSAGF